MPRASPSPLYLHTCRAPLPHRGHEGGPRQQPLEVALEGASNEVNVPWEESKHGKGTKVVQKSDGRAGVSTTDRNIFGDIGIRFDDDGSESDYIHTHDVWVLES